jgi:ABC-type Zn uptake system ZnuABC Zn-binding protein ZnuA
MGKVVKESGAHPRAVDLGAGRPVVLPGESGGTDPHWWHDPVNARYAVERLRDALVAADPKAAATLRGNATAYLQRLDSVTRGVADCIDQVPRAQRRLVTDHDAFGYFARRFGIRVVGAVIPSQTTQAQASAADIAGLVRLVHREHVRAIFPESSLSPKLAEQIARETGARADYTLYGDTLGPSGSPGATYLSMEQANADAMLRGFTGGARGCAITGIG